MQSTKMRKWLLPNLVVTAFLTATPTWAVGLLVDVTVVDRQTDKELPVYVHNNEFWVAGQPGAKYGVLLKNRSNARVLTVLSVDGVNAVTGETAGSQQSGYVLDRGTRTQVNGWRKSEDEIATFEFTAPDASYASRTGRPEHMGVIGVAIFKEKRPVPVVPNSMKRQYESMAQFEAAAADLAPGLGTGHGERERDEVRYTEFERASTHPTEVVRIRYDTPANLRARGIRIRTVQPSVAPNPFPRDGGFVPDPPA